MTCMIQNTAGRPVTVICNNGKALHLPPGYKHKIEEITIHNNAMVQKLVERHLISIIKPDKSKKKTGKEAASKKDAASNKAAKGAKSKTGSGAAGKKKSSGTKLSAKK